MNRVLARDRQKFLKVPNKPGQDYLTLLHPRRSGDAALQVRLLDGEQQALEVKLGKQTDYIFLFPESMEYDNPALKAALSGRVGIVRAGLQSNELILIDGKRLSYQGKTSWA
jgi:hypothetical protein